MKKNKKAQISSTLSWFVATIVIFFILMIFIFFSSLKTMSDKTKNIADNVEIVKTYAFLKEKQQRGLFVLFEEEINNTKVYYLTKDLDKVLENKKDTFSIPLLNSAFLVDKKKEEYISLENAIKEDLKNKEKFCQNYTLFIISNKTKEILTSESAAHTGVDDSGFEVFYYFQFPERNFPRSLIDWNGTTKEKSYSFFFPEKSFALIKYVLEECPNEKQKS